LDHLLACEIDEISLLARRCRNSMLFVGGDRICKTSGFGDDGVPFCFGDSFTFWIMGIGMVARVCGL